MSSMHKTFNKDVILLPSAGDSCVVRQGTKIKLHQKGHILNAFEFDKSWDSTAVINQLRQAFRSKIFLPDDVSLQILMPCGNKLLAPSLSEGQKMDANLIQKVFKKASLYLRPSVSLECMSSESSEAEDSLIEEDNVMDTSVTETPSCTVTAEHAASSHHEAPSEQPSTSGQTRFHPESDYGTYVNIIEDSEEEEEGDLISAIVASIEDQTRPKEDVPVSQILKELAEKINNNNSSKFNINRPCVLDGAIRGFRRLTFNPCNTLSVKFSDDKGTSEEAIDLGGPRREFLRLLMEALSQSEMFEGREGHLHLALDFTAVREDRYFYAGTAIAVSLVHGGPPPCFLSSTLFACIAEGPDMCKPKLDDITDGDLREKLRQVCEARNLQELKESIEPLTDYLSTAGCLRNFTSVTDKYQLLEDILMFQAVHRVRGPFERFRDGLKTLGVLQKIQLHPEAFRSLLCYSPIHLTADSLDELFQINWSETGSNKRSDENRMVAFWRDFLQDAEEENSTTKLQSVLTFTTGCNVVPPMGFSPQPSLEFLHTGGKYPVANTCINCLRLPLYRNYETFKEAMDFAIRNTQGFGMA